MIKLPDAITADGAPEVDEIYMAVDGMGLKGSYAAYAAGFNAAIEKVHRLNATAQPKCQKCGNTGMADSGGTQPWGEQILIECDCATAQPVSDVCKVPEGWKLVPIEPTEKMLIAGFESEPDDIFSNKLDQAEHRTHLCWNAMVAAAPGGQDA